MPQLNDAKAAYLAFRGFTGDIQDAEQAWLLSLPQTSGIDNHLQDLWYELMNALGFKGGNSLQDAQFEWLGSLGFLGSLQDRFLQFWVANEDISGGTGIDAPGNLQWAEPFPGFYLLYWDEPPQPVEGYRIYRNSDLYGSTTQTIFVTLETGVYQVQAFLGDNESPLSPPVNVA